MSNEKNIKKMLDHHSPEKKKNFLVATAEVGTVIAITLLCGCTLSPAKIMSSYFEKIKISISRQEDIELVRQGVPTLILLLSHFLVNL